MKELRRDNLGRPSWFGQTFFGGNPAFGTKLVEALKLLAPSWRNGVFTGDNLLTYGKNLSFLSDAKFMAAVEAHAATSVERSIIWRTAVLCWAARLALRNPGDFVECGCFKGTSARIIYDTIDFHSQTTRTYWLYDRFEFEGDTGIAEDLESVVHAKFAQEENVTIIRGSIPEVLEERSPSQIAFLHIDMNNVDAEIGALDVLFDRVPPGSPIILDDYGYCGYVKQRDAERQWLERRGYHVLELPTSQGLVIK